MVQFYKLTNGNPNDEYLYISWMYNATVCLWWDRYIQNSCWKLEKKTRGIKKKITQASNVDLHIEAGQDQEKKQTINRLVATN
jgi:hypothetical protein